MLAMLVRGILQRSRPRGKLYLATAVMLQAWNWKLDHLGDEMAEFEMNCIELGGPIKRL